MKTAPSGSRVRARFLRAIASLGLALALWAGGLVPRAAEGAATAARTGETAEPESGGWWEVETTHFRLLTDADPRRGVEIARRLEDFRGVFARLAPSLELRSPAPTTLFAFRDAESYAPYKTRADSGNSRVLGQFARTRDGNYLTIDASSQLADAFTVIYHEYVHFLVTHNFPRVPLWFNEGLAEYYSTFAVEGEGAGPPRAFLGEPVERHLRYLAREGDFSLDALIEADTSSEVYHDPDEAGRFYALSWALVHYLMSGGGEEIERTADYFLRLDEGEPPARAFEGAFGRYLSTMEDELRTYLQTGNYATTRLSLPAAPPTARVRRLPLADALYHLGDLLVHLGFPSRAEAYFHAGLEADSQHAESHAGLAHVRDLSNRWLEAESLYRDAVKLGPRTALTWLLYGRHSLAGIQSPEADAADSAERARRSLAEAVKMDPGFGEAHALLAAAHLGAGGEPEKGLRAVRKARGLLPHRVDLVSLHIQLLLGDRQVEAARKVLARDLEPVAEREFERYEQAREAVERTQLLLDSEAAFEAENPEQGLRLLDLAVHLTTDPQLRERLEGELLRLQRLHARP